MSDDLVTRLQTEADQCRNDGADDIARLLDEAAAALVPSPAEAHSVRATGVPADGVAMRSRSERFKPNDGGKWIDDDDFGFDAMLKVDGDFGSDADRLAYAQFICDKLNADAPNVQPKHTAPGWADAYAAFQGAFDTPLARRRMDDEFCQDARRRLREFNDAMLAAQAPAPAHPAAWRTVVAAAHAFFAGIKNSGCEVKFADGSPTPNALLMERLHRELGELLAAPCAAVKAEPLTAMQARHVVGGMGWDLDPNEVEDMEMLVKAAERACAAAWGVKLADASHPPVQNTGASAARPLLAGAPHHEGGGGGAVKDWSDKTPAANSSPTPTGGEGRGVEVSGLAAEGSQDAGATAETPWAGKVDSSGLTAEGYEASAPSATAGGQLDDAPVPEPADSHFTRMLQHLGRNPA